MTGVFERYFDGTYDLGKSAGNVKDNLRAEFELLARSGKQALIVLDNPTLPFYAKECMRRPINLGQANDCTFDRAIHETSTKRYRELFKRLGEEASKNVTIFDPTELFCDPSKCSAVDNDGLLYTGDDNRGAMVVGRSILKMFP